MRTRGFLFQKPSPFSGRMLTDLSKVANPVVWVLIFRLQMVLPERPCERDEISRGQTVAHVQRLNRQCVCPDLNQITQDAIFRELIYPLEATF